MLDWNDLLWYTHNYGTDMPFVLDVRTSLSANVIQRALIKSAQDLHHVDSFDKKLGNAARLNSEKT